VKQLKRIYRAIKLALTGSQTVTNPSKDRRLRAAQNEFEIDRLDRLRNPSKYQGK
jgi:hypothetical protein